MQRVNITFWDVRTNISQDVTKLNDVKRYWSVMEGKKK